jgi:hypothetical protein
MMARLLSICELMLSLPRVSRDSRSYLGLEMAESGERRGAVAVPKLIGLSEESAVSNHSRQ